MTAVVLALLLAGVDGADPLVTEQIRQAERAVAVAVAARADRAPLADAYGVLGRTTHAYELFEQAEAAYVEAARLRPNDPRWPYLLGYLHQQTGRLEEAASRFVEARGLNPANLAATVRLGQVYLALGRLREARDEFDRVRDVFPALARQGLGEVALRERRFDAAAEHFRDVLMRVPQATATHYSLAMAYRGLGRLDKARVHLGQRGSGGLRIGDPIVDGLQDLVRGERGLVMQGRRAYEAGQFADAAAAFGRAVATAPGSATARFNLGMAMLQLGDTAPAIAHLQAAFDLQPGDADTGRELSRVLLRAGRTADAIATLVRTTSFHPDDEDAVVSLAILFADRQRYRDAMVLLDAAVRRRPAALTVATTLARLLASAPDRSLRDGTRALALASAVHQADPAPAHAETVAMSLAELGRCPEAATWLRRAVADAEQAGDAEETGRLTRELSQYPSADCRRP